MITFHAIPLEKHSSLHKASIFHLLGIKTQLAPKLTITFNFNLQTDISAKPQAHLNIHLRDANGTYDEMTKKSDLRVENIRRWRLNIASFASFTDFLQKMNPRIYKKYLETQKVFNESGSRVSVINNDWSQYADSVYQLYRNVAKRNGAQLYDLIFFRKIAQHPSYKLMCLWHKDTLIGTKDTLIGALVMVDEAPTFHSAICAFDYDHSKKCRAYSIMHYEFLRIAFNEKNKYTTADIGITADKAKSLMGYHPVLSCMEVSARNWFLMLILRSISRFIMLSVNSDAELEWRFKRFQLFPTKIKSLNKEVLK